MPFSFEEKLDRANQHLQMLELNIKSWLLTNPYSIFNEIDPDTGDDVVHIQSLNDPPRLLALLVGDCLYNFRSALDHLVYALSIKHTPTLSDEQVTATAFPIFNTFDGFRQRASGKIAHISERAKTIIKGLQPYQAGHNATLEPLWSLEKLQNIDKHRTLLLTVTAQYGAELNNPLGARMELFQFTRADPTKTNAEFARYRFRNIEDGARVKMDIKPILQIAFGNAPAEGHAMLERVWAIRREIVGRVLPQLGPFL